MCCTMGVFILIAFLRVKCQAHDRVRWLAWTSKRMRHCNGTAMARRCDMFCCLLRPALWSRRARLLPALRSAG